MKCGLLVFCTLVIQLTSAKPGDYSTYGGEYGGVSEYGGAFPDSPAALVTQTDLKPASTFDIGYGSPEPSFPFFPNSEPFRFRNFGWGGGWQKPIIAPIPVITKHIPVQILPFGWGWQNPGIF